MTSHGNDMDLHADACPEADVLYAFADDGLSADERNPVERHAAGCSNCRQRLNETEELQRLARTLAKTRLNRRDYERIDRCTTRTLAEDARFRAMR